MLLVGIIREDDSFSPVYLFNKDYQLSDKEYAIARTAYHDYEIEVNREDLIVPDIEVDKEGFDDNKVTIFTKNKYTKLGLNSKRVIQYDATADGNYEEERNVSKSAFDLLGE